MDNSIALHSLFHNVKWYTGMTNLDANENDYQYYIEGGWGSISDVKYCSSYLASKKIEIDYIA